MATRGMMSGKAWKRIRSARKGREGGREGGREERNRKLITTEEE